MGEVGEEGEAAKGVGELGLPLTCAPRSWIGPFNAWGRGRGRESLCVRAGAGGAGGFDSAAAAIHARGVSLPAKVAPHEHGAAGSAAIAPVYKLLG